MEKKERNLITMDSCSPVNFTNPDIPINFDEAKEAYRGCEIV